MTRGLIVVLLVFALWQIAIGGWIQTKAWLGQVLLERAWSTSAEAGGRVPWPGAVSYPVARLSLPELALDWLVLQGLDGAVLAWGPGTEMGPKGHRVIAAHRDTHFRPLEQVKPGQLFRLETNDGSVDHWRVVETSIVDARLNALDMGLNEQRLTLVTCYPFDGSQPGGPLRFVVSLVPDRSDNNKIDHNTLKGA